MPVDDDPRDEEQAELHPAPAPAPAPQAAVARGAGPISALWGIGISALWALAIILGSLREVLQGFPRTVFFSLDGQPVDRCIAFAGPDNPGGPMTDVTEDQWSDWCTPTEWLGQSLPDGVATVTGDISWSDLTLDVLVTAVSRPELWFSVAAGASAMFVFVAFARATGTVRAGLAAAVSVVFLALLLFPAAFTYQVPGDLRTELVSAWQWIISFYFVSEAGVQAWKITKGGPSVQGDLDPG